MKLNKIKNNIVVEEGQVIDFLQILPSYEENESREVKENGGKRILCEPCI